MANIYDMADTWNNGATTFTAIKMNVTDTASNAASLLLDLQVGGTSKASVKKDGLLSTIYASLSGQSLTGSAATSLLDLATTWNTSGTPSAIKLNVTNTASNAASNLMLLQVGGSNRFRVGVNGQIYFAQGVYGPQVALWGDYNTAISLSGASCLSWGSGAPTIGTLDTSLNRSAAGVVGIRGNSPTAGGALEFLEQTAPSAPGANAVRLYAQDNGAGKTQLMALFNTGAAQQVAIEP
ncbi:MAG: hypothetical protein IPK75_18565 [Acidobacteria bacterium]|nr:hypothetical protein [Acidobacteriota bacterium]